MKQAILTTVIIALMGCENEKVEQAPAPLAGSPAIDAAIRKAAGKPQGELAKADLEKVKELAIPYSKLTDISVLAELTQLQILDLGYNQITDVSALKEITQLEELSLRENQLTDVSPLAGLDRLKVLDLYGNADLSLAKITALQKSLPKCRIDHNAEK